MPAGARSTVPGTGGATSVLHAGGVSQAAVPSGPTGLAQACLPAPAEGHRPGRGFLAGIRRRGRSMARRRDRARSADRVTVADRVRPPSWPPRCSSRSWSCEFAGRGLGGHARRGFLLSRFLDSWPRCQHGPDRFQVPGLSVNPSRKESFQSCALHPRPSFKPGWLTHVRTVIAERIALIRAGLVACIAAERDIEVVAEVDRRERSCPPSRRCGPMWPSSTVTSPAPTGSPSSRPCTRSPRPVAR